MQKNWFVIMPLLIGIAVAPILSAQQMSSQLSEDQAVGLMRTINTAQMGWFSRHQTFANLSDLEQDKLLSECEEILNSTGIDSASVEGYELKVLVPFDGRHYSTSLTPAHGCGVAMFSTDQGVIFRATALGCQ